MLRFFFLVSAAVAKKNQGMERVGNVDINGGCDWGGLIVPQKWKVSNQRCSCFSLRNYLRAELCKYRSSLVSYFGNEARRDTI